MQCYSDVVGINLFITKCEFKTQYCGMRVDSMAMSTSYMNNVVITGCCRDSQHGEGLKVGWTLPDILRTYDAVSTYYIYTLQHLPKPCEDHLLGNLFSIDWLMKVNNV